uniref:Uncharacterized protein n=1 Tax=Cacopsylla melanoneura TaxID=428564 RepID=A0A8D8RL71_9HEMI
MSLCDNANLLSPTSHNINCIGLIGGDEVPGDSAIYHIRRRLSRMHDDTLDIIGNDNLVVFSICVTYPPELRKTMSLTNQSVNQLKLNLWTNRNGLLPFH